MTTVTDNRTTISNADATTGWTGSATVATNASDPAPIQGTNCLAMQVSSATQNAYFTLGAAVDMSAGFLIYQWINHRAALDTTANGGLQIQIGDGTNRIGFGVAGSDIAGFRSDTGPVGWQCLLLDTGNLPSFTTVYAGTLAALNLKAITQVGVAFKTLAKSVGGAVNCFWDINYYAPPGTGITVTGGTAGTPAVFEDIATADQNQAIGVLRKLGTKTYGVQGTITFGDSSGTTATYFADTNCTVLFESRGLRDNKYNFNVVGNATGSTTFQLGTKVGSGDTASGSDGCSIIIPSGVGGRFLATNNNLQFLKIYGSRLSGFTRGISLSRDGTNGPNHEFIGSTVAGSGLFKSGKAVVRNATITGTVSPITSAGYKWDDFSDVKNSAFTSNLRAMLMESDWGDSVRSQTISFTGITFSGNTKDILNTSGGPITINVASGGSTPTFENAYITKWIPGEPRDTLIPPAGGANTPPNFEAEEFRTFENSLTFPKNAVTLSITNVVVGSNVAIIADSGGPEVVGTILLNTTAASSTVSTNYAYLADQPIIIRVRRSQTGFTRYFPISTTGIISSTGFSLRIEQIPDTIASP